MRITVNDLKEKGACLQQLDVFRAEWPDGGEITLAGLYRAVELKLDLEWFASKFLSSIFLSEYKRQMARLRAEYIRQTASNSSPILAEYKRQMALFIAEYKRQTAPILWAILEQNNT